MQTLEETLTCTARTTRRSLLGAGIAALWAAIASAFGIPAGTYLLSAPRTARRKQWVEAADVARLAADEPVEMAFVRRRTDAWCTVDEKATAWVVKRAGEVVAFNPGCTHLGCAYGWNAAKRQFVCPCHASLFAIDGRVLAGPAPRPLDRFETRIEGGKLLVRL